MAARLVKNRLAISSGKIEARFRTLPKRAYEFWRKTTPKRTGNARRKTILQKDTIRARYPYAQRLDEGYSRQAPRGMLEPTIKFMDRITKGFMRK